MSIVAGATVGQLAVPSALDHLVYAVPDLEAAAAAFADATGVEPAPGGRHLGLGTRNVLARFGPTSYLEIIGPDRDHPADDGAAVPFGVDTLTAPRLVTCAVHPVDLDAARAAAAEAGADLGPTWPLSRQTPDGTELRWRLASVHPAPFAGVTPFLIDWGDTPHPAGNAALPTVGLTGIRLSHPNPAAVTAVLTALDQQVPVTEGPAGLVAVFDTPQGRVSLT